jgi:hypothetical protein
MKNQPYRFLPLLVPLFSSAILTSCVVPVETEGSHYTSTGGGHMVYTTLPTSFVGSAYYYDGRYYSGGRYQTGTYSYRGRPYSNRYHYNGKYYYGGRYQEHGARDTRSNNRREEDRRDSRHSSNQPATTHRSTGQIPASQSRY